MYDQAGDVARDRHSAPLVLGDSAAGCCSLNVILVLVLPLVLACTCCGICSACRIRGFRRYSNVVFANSGRGQSRVFIMELVACLIGQLAVGATSFGRIELAQLFWLSETTPSWKTDV